MDGKRLSHILEKLRILLNKRPRPPLKAVEGMNSAIIEQSVELLPDFLPAILAVTNAVLKDQRDIDVKRRM